MASDRDAIGIGCWHGISCISLALLAFAFSSPVSAQPTLSVSDLGLNASMNREWLIEVAPDPALFTNTNNGFGSSLGIELAFEVTGSDLVGSTVNAVDFPFDIPGNNPFTASVTAGLQTDLATDTVFASLLSEFFTTGDDVEVLTIETMGSAATTLSWGGHVVLPGTPFEYIGSRIAQAGVNYDGYMGSASSGGGVNGDFNGDGNWDCTDINALTAAIATTSMDLSFDMNGDGSITAADITEAGTGWLAVGGANNPAQTMGNPFLVGDATLDGVVDGLDFIEWNMNKFTALPEWCGGDFTADGIVDGLDFIEWNVNKFTSSDSHPVAVPEPAGLALLLISIVAMCCWHRLEPA